MERINIGLRTPTHGEVDHFFDSDLPNSVVDYFAIPSELLTMIVRMDRHGNWSIRLPVACPIRERCYNIMRAPNRISIGFVWYQHESGRREYCSLIIINNRNGNVYYLDNYPNPTMVDNIAEFMQTHLLPDMTLNVCNYPFRLNG